MPCASTVAQKIFLSLFVFSVGFFVCDKFEFFLLDILQLSDSSEQ